jgi:hypothetical protein
MATNNYQRLSTLDTISSDESIIDFDNNRYINANSSKGACILHKKDYNNFLLLLHHLF